MGKRPSIDTLKLLALITNFNDPDWPDHLDTESGLFTYYGDNKTARGIHDTLRQGNQILRNLFDARHSPVSLDHFPVVLLFGGSGQYRDMRFLGLAVPGAQNLGPDDDLVAIWRSKGPDNFRFQNYKSIFTILDVPVISRKWLNDVKAGNAVSSSHAPRLWLEWVSGRRYSPLYAPHSIDIRNKEQQLPKTAEDYNILSLLHEKYQDNPIGFEAAAVEISRLFMPDIGHCEITRPWRDGGRDAVGAYRIGLGRSAIEVEFALEAKCYAPNGKGVGVRELSRLLSRLRHRQFGVLVTTSYLATQAYRELKEDQHPVVIISGIDIVTTLKKRVGSLDQIKRWLESL
ncbi:restriction endonuclease [Marinobacter metalliresistant]|uniref:Restriction endonuclease n=1 Tax=Marinobacter metalliresistant TaxID=2961995 RepID=A0ABZ2W7H8_9GAMM